MKRFVLLGFVLALALVLVGCNNNQDSDDGDTVSITYWSIFPIGGDGTDIHDGYLDEFRDAHPDVKIEHIGYGFWDYWTALQTAQAGGDGPDLYIQDVANVKGRAENLSLNLDALMKKYGVSADDYLQADVDSCSLNGSMYALPFESDARFLYWNKDHFASVGLDPERGPTTLAELEEFSEKLTIMSADGKIAERIGFHPRLGNNTFVNTVWSQGGEFFDAAGNLTVNTPEALEALTWWVHMVNKFDARVYNAFNSQASSLNISPFIQEKVSMIIEGDYLTWTIEKNRPDLNYGVCLFPYAEGSAVAWGGGFSMEVANKSSAVKQDAAFRLAAHLCGESVQSRIADDLAFMPCHIGALDKVAASADSNQKYVLENTKYRRHYDYNAALPQWWSVIEGQLQNAEAGRITVAEALTAAEKDMKASIDNYNSLKGK